MEKWKYFDITHKFHVLCNPMSEEKFKRFCNLLNLSRDSQVLDIACGKGEVLVRLAEKYGSAAPASVVNATPLLEKSWRKNS